MIGLFQTLRVGISKIFLKYFMIFMKIIEIIGSEIAPFNLFGEFYIFSRHKEHK